MLTVDNKIINTSTSVSVEENTIDTESMLSSTANWVKIKSETITETFENEIEKVGMVAVGAVLAEGLGIASAVALLIADMAIADQPTTPWIKCYKDTYANSYALNHYKYVIAYFGHDGYISTNTSYNPPIY